MDDKEIINRITKILKVKHKIQYTRKFKSLFCIVGKGKEGFNLVINSKDLSLKFFKNRAWNPSFVFSLSNKMPNLGSFLVLFRMMNDHQFFEDIRRIFLNEGEPYEET